MGSRYEEIMKSKSYLPLKMNNYLPDWMVEKATIELNETDENRGPALEELRKLISGNPALNCWTDDAYLLQYLRARKFNVKRAYELLDMFYTVKKNFSEVYPEEFDRESVIALMDYDAGGFLPYRDEEGAVVLLLKMGKWDTDKVPLNVVLSAMTSLILYCVEEPATQICGVHIILDVQGANFKQFRCLTSTTRYLSLFAKALRNTLPVRFKAIHIFNESFIFTSIFAVLKIFLSEKIKKRIHFHGTNAKHIHKLVPKAILPEKYGGDNLTYNNAEWCRSEMPTFFDRFAELHRCGY